MYITYCRFLLVKTNINPVEAPPLNSIKGEKRLRQMGELNQKCFRNYTNMVFKINANCIENDLQTFVRLVAARMIKLANTLLNEMRLCKVSKYNTEQI